MHLLFVCTGNICRSPLAERLTTAFAAEADVPGLTATSAGTGALVGRPMDPDAAVVLAGLGGDADGFGARAFLPWMAEQADLVLTLERGHRSTVLERAPRALRRTFTLREASAVLGLLRPTDLPTATDLDERGRHLVAALARRRNDWRGSSGATDITDPYRRPPEVHAQVGSDIAAALLPLLRALAGPEVDRRAG
ncbi:arsenate reductase/protein-tyrosine-phosphatase family protein [Klenkia brasiliensis]|uniref:Protein-tyrosine phosphatase n=1 Tax=Klenkia brasiliensis TaxID=333142 RepID=A0A1G7MT11_9ACTN|nr:hypothetical protein [Klenkia brasiliensis]SDF64200.1 protein-tyrosine phosphatase [Klenkia brasiliensis]